jgi:hypothetical protein
MQPCILALPERESPELTRNARPVRKTRPAGNERRTRRKRPPADPPTHRASLSRVASGAAGCHSTSLSSQAVGMGTRQRAWAERG